MPADRTGSYGIVLDRTGPQRIATDRNGSDLSLAAHRVARPYPLEHCLRHDVPLPCGIRKRQQRAHLVAKRTVAWRAPPAVRPFPPKVLQPCSAMCRPWLDDDVNLARWENGTLTASERRILLSHWFADAVKKALEKTRALRAYFEHTGCLMTIDGSEDHLIKLEGVPRKDGENFVFEDAEMAEVPTTAADEPEDEAPQRDDHEGDNEEEHLLDEEDDDEPDETGAPPAPFEIPAGFRLADAPSDAQLQFKSAAAAELVGRSILFNWAAAGWCLGEITRTNTDGRRTIEKGVPANFFVYYEIDENESKHLLALEEHGYQEVPNAWVLLEEE